MNCIPVIRGYQTDPEQDGQDPRWSEERVRDLNQNPEFWRNLKTGRSRRHIRRIWFYVRILVHVGEGEKTFTGTQKVFDLSKDGRSTVPVRAKAKFSAEFRNFQWLKILWIIGYDSKPMIIVSKPALKPILKAFLIWHLYCVQSTPNAIAPADNVAISALNIFNTEYCSKYYFEYI